MEISQLSVAWIDLNSRGYFLDPCRCTEGKASGKARDAIPAI